MQSGEKSSVAGAQAENLTRIYELVLRVFNDEDKARIWLRTPNPMLGGFSPRDMARKGRYDRLLRFVMRAIEEGQSGGPDEVLAVAGGNGGKLPDSERQESIEKAWRREIEGRVSELDSGTAETVSWELVRARLRGLRD